MILIAPHREELTGPVIFLAGPIQGAPDWQTEAMGLLGVNPYIHVVSPRQSIQKKEEFSDQDYFSQIEWEHHYLDVACKSGVVMFWLPKPIEIIQGRAYAQTTRFELGEMVARHYLSGVRLVIGIEKGFGNDRYIRRTLELKAPKVSVCSTLEETCESALTFFR